MDGLLWKITTIVCIGYLFYRGVRKRASVTRQAASGPMLGFSWGDSVEQVAKWCKAIGLRYRGADNATAMIVYLGKFPGALTKATYSFYMPCGKLDAIAALIADSSGYTYNALADDFARGYGEAWDEGENNATWLLDDVLIVLLQGKSGLLHVRFLNLGNLPEGREVDDEHDGIIEGLLRIDEELVRRKK